MLGNSSNKNILYTVSYINNDNAQHPTKGKKEFEIICKLLPELFSEDTGDSVSEIIGDIIDRITFLYKREDCSSDKEARIVKYAEVSKAMTDGGFLENDRSPKLYYPVSIPDNTMEEIYIGNHVKKPEQLAQFLYKTGKVKNISRSKVKID